MQMTYHITCKCGHDFPIPGKFLSTDEQERDALIKVLEGLLCHDCIQAAIDELHALREHLLKIGVAHPNITEEVYTWDGPGALGIAEEIQKISELLPQLDVAENWNRHFPVGTEVLVTQTGDEQPGDLLAYHTYLTTSPARLLAGKPVVEVSGLGPIDLNRVIPFFA